MILYLEGTDCVYTRIYHVFLGMFCVLSRVLALPNIY